MIKENTIEGYFNLDEPNDLGDTHHSGSWSKDHLDPTNTWATACALFTTIAIVASNSNKRFGKSTLAKSSSSVTWSF